MAKGIKTNIEILITNLSVDQFYHSFEYEVKVNGKERATGEIQSDHIWGQDIKWWKKELKKEAAVKAVLDLVFS